jgi:hypothetical protein
MSGSFDPVAYEKMLILRSSRMDHPLHVIVQSNPAAGWSPSAILSASINRGTAGKLTMQPAQGKTALLLSHTRNVFDPSTEVEASMDIIPLVDGGSAAVGTGVARLRVSRRLDENSTASVSLSDDPRKRVTWSFVERQRLIDLRISGVVPSDGSAPSVSIKHTRSF